VILFVLFLLLFLPFLHAKNMLDAVQEIHKTVGSSLLSIRKNHPESQVQVYTTIDQVSKLCDLSKRQHSKRKQYKLALADEKAKALEMKNKIELVAQKMSEAQKKIAEQAEKITLLTVQKEEAIASLQKNLSAVTQQNSFKTAFRAPIVSEEKELAFDEQESLQEVKS
jgi:hypothetical protein